MIGSVDYRDSVRTLLADTVTYFERADRIVARGRVSLTRRATGSTLDGPVVEFLRAVRPGPQRTVATGRPHMTLHADTAARDTTPPMEVDADSVVLVGDREARAWGDVRIRRPDLDARADSAFFQLEEGEGRLFGSPVVTGENYRLSGRTIHTRFHEGELEAVEAVEDARASGEGAEMPEDPYAEMPLSPGERSWVAADTLHLVFAAAPDSAAAAGAPADAAVADAAAEDTTGAEAPVPVPDTARAAAAGAAGDTVSGREDRRLRTMRAVGRARAYYLLQPEEEGDRPGRHYQRGQEIVVHFRDGEAHRILGLQAIGVHLDPVEGAGGGAGADTAPPVPDTVGASDDTSGAAPDTAARTPAPAPDTAAPAPDSAGAAPDGPEAAPDTAGRTRDPRSGMGRAAARSRRPRQDSGGSP